VGDGGGLAFALGCGADITHGVDDFYRIGVGRFGDGGEFDDFDAR
jgi:hypothetical protein